MTRLTKVMSRKELEQFQQTLDPVVWKDVEMGKVDKKVYNKYIYQKNRVHDLLTPFVLSDMRVEGDLKRNKMFKETRDVEIQMVTDRLHKETCSRTHDCEMMACLYTWGNWENDVREDMYDFYLKAEKLVAYVRKYGLI